MILPSSFLTFIQIFDWGGVNMDDLTEREKYILMRKRKKISLNELAQKIGCSISLLSKYENGKINIDQSKERKYKQIIREWGNSE